MKTSSRHGKSGFTLIEMMAVITIIVILAGLVVGGLGFVTERQAKEKARVQLALLAKALDEYKLDNGSYPVTANKAQGDGSSAILYKALFGDGLSSGKIYLADLNPTTSKQGWVDPIATGTPPATLTGQIKDPWGNEYRYRSALNPGGAPNADTVNPDYDLWSVGKDGVTNGANNPAGVRDTKNKDDIRNF